MTTKTLAAYLLLIAMLSTATGYYLGASMALISNHQHQLQPSRLHLFAAPQLKGSIHE